MTPVAMAEAFHATALGRRRASDLERTPEVTDRGALGGGSCGWRSRQGLLRAVEEGRLIFSQSQRHVVLHAQLQVLGSARLVALLL